MMYRNDIAYTMGHRSFAILGNVYNGIIKSIENQQEMFKAEFSSTTIVENHRNTEMILCMEAIILYQIFMEALVNDIITENELFSDIDINNTKKYTFAVKWKVVLKRFNAPDEIYTTFNHYLTMYREYRNKLVHPKDRKEIKNRRNIRFYNVYLWLKSGWDVYEFVYACIGTPHTIDSWNTMGKIYNLLPFEEIEKYNEFDLESIEWQLYRDLLKKERGEIGK